MDTEILKRFDLGGNVAVITGAGGALCGTMADALGAMWREGGRSGYQPGESRGQVQSIAAPRGRPGRLSRRPRPVRLRKCCAEIERLWGPPDFLINGAGGNDPRGTPRRIPRPRRIGFSAAQSFFDLDPNGFSKVFELNFMGTFLTTQAFAKRWSRRGKASSSTSPR